MTVAMNKFAPFAHPMYIMAKPAGALCNLSCRYCYYLEKEHLYTGGAPVMSNALLERFTQEYIEAQTTREVLFTWHGGEPLTRPLSFYRQAVEMQKQYARGHVIDNCIQTNGVLLNDEWCRFLKEEGWLVGISIDGPEEFHDAFRRDKQGRPTFAQVIKGIELLQKYDIPWNGMAVVNSLNGNHPLEFYHFFKEIGCHYLQFTPVVERNFHHADGRYLSTPEQTGEETTDFSVNPRQWGEFLCTLFDEWVRNDVGTYFIQMFDATLCNWMGEAPGSCAFGEYCGHAGAMEYNGDVYACDHFVTPEHRLGNIREKSLVEMMYGEKQRRFGLMKREGLPSTCRACEFLFACNGECPRNRFVVSPQGEKGLNYLCQGYRQYFRHVAPYMDFMKRELLAGRAPANIMQALFDSGGDVTALMNS